jgi:transcriptional regulator with XRE-family HTH domain
MGKVRKLGGLHAVIAGNVRRLRGERGLSQEALADICGYHRTYVGGIERGERNITIATLEALAGALGVEPLRLLERGEGAASRGTRRLTSRPAAVTVSQVRHRRL